MTLKNAVNESGETDGLIDEIIFELSNNYNDKTATCKITQSKDENNEIVKEEEHVSEADHVMLFESTYKANSVSWQPIVRKKLIGRDWVINDSFRFDIITEEKSGMILPDIKNRYIEIRPDGQSSTDEGASFVGSLKTPIKFTAPGTYNFEIKETFNNHNGITVDTTSHIIKIDIIDDNEGNLLIKYNNQETNPVMEFVNTYSESEKIKFAISKELKNRKWSNSDKFTFTITPSKTTETSINDGIIKMPDSLGQLKDGCYTVNISKEDGDTNIGAIIKNLGDIVITKGDENQQQYTFTVEEKLDNLTNIECSDNKVIVDIVAVKQSNRKIRCYHNLFIYIV